VAGFFYAMAMTGRLIIVARVKTLHRHTFSLVELIVVISIAAALMVLTLPAFNSMVTGAGVKSGSRNAATLIALGRSYAMAKRRHVAVIMPGPEASSGLRAEDAFRAMRLAYVTYDGTDLDFDEWVEDSSWLFMPKGTTIMEADADTGIQDSISYAKIPEENNMTQVDGVNLSGPLAGSASVNDVRAVVFTPTGKVRGESLYLTIGEAIYTGYWSIVNQASTATNKSSSNQITLEVNRFTGTVTFLNPEDY
jgi:type II secretory pathway pseudopilin PulG